MKTLSKNKIRFKSIQKMRAQLRVSTNFLTVARTYVNQNHNYTQRQWKVTLLKFRYFENYIRNLDGYFTFRVYGQLQTRLEQKKKKKKNLLALQLGSSCCTCILCFLRFIKMWKHYFQKQICQCMPARYSLKTPSKWFRLFTQIQQARLRRSGTTTTWQVPIELNGNICVH